MLVQASSFLTSRQQVWPLLTIFNAGRASGACLSSLVGYALACSARLGGGYGGKWNIHYLLLKWHMALWQKLAKLPGPLGNLGSPEFTALGQEHMPYRKVSSVLLAPVC